MIDYNILQELATKDPMRAVEARHGAPGMSALKSLMAFLSECYKIVDVESVTSPLVVIHPLSGFSEDSLPSNPTHCSDIESLRAKIKGSGLICLRNRGFDYWAQVQINLTSLSNRAIVYCFEPDAERFVVDGVEYPVQPADSAQASVFSRPAYGDLREALEKYRSRIRHSSCRLFIDAWEDDKRLFFASGPEEAMRRSLHQFLDTVLRDAEVRPEQNVDESHPIDVKITWRFSNRLALIEIKWLGKSRKNGEIRVKYSDSRAREGATQLSNYLDANLTAAPDNVTRGYLVVFDGRRHGLNDSSTQIDRAAGFHYESREIHFDPEYHKVRDDFEEPIRLFCEPKCTAT